MEQDLYDLRMRGLQEIFHFYSRQHIGLNKDFDDLKEIMNEIGLGEFTKFCADFSIPLQKSKISEIFKKCSINHKPQKFEQFQLSLGRIGSEICRQRIEEINERVKEINKTVRQNNMAVEHTMEKEALTQEKHLLLVEKEDLETKSED